LWHTARFASIPDAIRCCVAGIGRFVDSSVKVEGTDMTADYIQTRSA
jgi:hypothetical protein